MKLHNPLSWWIAVYILAQGGAVPGNGIGLHIYMLGNAYILTGNGIHDPISASCEIPSLLSISVCYSSYPSTVPVSVRPFSELPLLVFPAWLQPLTLPDAVSIATHPPALTMVIVPFLFSGSFFSGPVNLT